MAESMKQEVEQEGQLVDLDERRWLPRHISGDRTAFAELISAYRARVYTYLVRCGMDSSSRDDLFQEIFMKVHKAAAHYQPNRPLRPWLFTIVANTVRNHYRQLRVEEVAFSERAEARQRAREPSAEQAVEVSETLTWLEEAIKGLPLPQREVLILTCVEEMDQKAVAAALQMPINTVKTHLRRARLALCRERARRSIRGAS